VNERGDKHSLAGVRKPGNTKPNRRIEQMAAELDGCSSGEPNLFNELKHNNRFQAVRCGSSPRV